MKPKTKEEAHLRRKFEREGELLEREAQLGRDAREAKRIWKRQTSKLNRKLGKQEIQRELDGGDE